MRFCATLNDEALRNHVDGLWARDAVVLAAHDGPLWSGPLHRAGPVRALAELVVTGEEAELGISVDASMRRRGVGTYMVQTAARLLAPRGVRRIRATTLNDNHSFVALAQSCGAEVGAGRTASTSSSTSPRSTAPTSAAARRRCSAPSSSRGRSRLIAAGSWRIRRRMTTRRIIAICIRR